MKTIRLLTAGLAAFGLSMFGAMSAHADHDGLLYPVADWQVRQIQTGDTDWSDATASTVIDATTLELTKPAGDTGTSAETADLGAEGDTVTVDVALDGDAVAAAGAIRLFAYDDPDADTLAVGPTAKVVASGSGTLTLDVSGFAGPIGTLGLVYDASNSSAGTVTFTNLQVDGETVSFTPHVEPEACEWNDELLADDEKCVEPEDTDSDKEQDTETEKEADETDSTPAAVPTAVPAGSEPVSSGASTALIGLAGVGLAVLAAGGFLLRRRLDN